MRKSRKKDPLLALDLVEALKRYTVADMEGDPDLKRLIGKAAREEADRRLLEESINTIPYNDLQRLFGDLIEDRFDAYMQTFFDKLYRGLTKSNNRTVNRKLNRIKQSIDELRGSMLMAHINPLSWWEAELVVTALRFLDTMPNKTASVKQIYTHLAYSSTMLPIPGVTLSDKLLQLVKIFRRVEALKEYDGFLFEHAKTEVIEEEAAYATAGSHGKTLQRALRSMGSKDATPASDTAFDGDDRSTQGNYL
jgi:hypothetical protein